MHNFYSKNEANIWSNLENAPNFLCSNSAEQRYLDWELVRGVSSAGAGAGDLPHAETLSCDLPCSGDIYY